MINPDHIRIAFDGSSYWIERRVFTRGIDRDDPFGKKENLITKWDHVFGYIGEDGWWSGDLKEESNKEGVFVRQYYYCKGDALRVAKELCTQNTYFDIHGNVIKVASQNNSPYIMDESAKKFYKERLKTLEEWDKRFYEERSKGKRT